VIDLKMAAKNFKGCFTQKNTRALTPFRDTPLNKLVRYYMKQGRHLTSYKACLKAFRELYFILSQNLSLQTFDQLGGYSPLAGEFLQTNRFFNPQAVVE
jgi:hypothetical protein